jgi:hypothetical protein
MTPANLAIVFAPNLLRARTDDPIALLLGLKKAAEFVEMLIVNYKLICDVVEVRIDEHTPRVSPRGALAVPDTGDESGTSDDETTTHAADDATVIMVTPGADSHSMSTPTTATITTTISDDSSSSSSAPTTRTITATTPTLTVSPPGNTEGKKHVRTYYDLLARQASPASVESPTPSGSEANGATMRSSRGVVLPSRRVNRHSGSATAPRTRAPPAPPLRNTKRRHSRSREIHVCSRACARACVCVCV